MSISPNPQIPCNISSQILSFFCFLPARANPGLNIIFLTILFSYDGENFQEFGRRSIHGHLWAGTLQNYNGRPLVVGGTDENWNYHKKSELLDLKSKEWEETTEYPWGYR